MRFLLDDAQREFARSLDGMLTAAGTPAVVRAWSAGDHGPGRALWSRLADAGVFALAVPDAHQGLNPHPVELVVAFEQLGRHAVPGPLVETVAVAALLDRLDDPALAADRLPGIASGKTAASLCLLTDSPYALCTGTPCAWRSPRARSSRRRTRRADWPARSAERTWRTARRSGRRRPTPPTSRHWSPPPRPWDSAGPCSPARSST
jgi:hypothetical protein